MTKISEILDCLPSKCPTRKVARLVGLVKHVEAGGDGNAFVSLKDPSGSIGATVQSEVVENPTVRRGEISPGAVLVLEKVSLFSPDDKNQCLCITLSNILQVFA